eukprot:scaffold85689_cov63-Phaeocystis_antarctica.AAC.2
MQSINRAHAVHMHAVHMQCKYNVHTAGLSPGRSRASYLRAAAARCRSGGGAAATAAAAATATTAAVG